MERLTIDNILSESRGEPQTFEFGKEASAEVSQEISNDEIEKMAQFLADAAVPDNVAIGSPEVPTEDFEEKVASALVLSSTLAALQETEKLAGFRENALQAGYAEADIDNFIEKEAKMSMFGSLAKHKKLLGTAALAGAAGSAAGYKGGTTTERKKGQKRSLMAAATGYRVGVRRGRHQGYRVGRHHQMSISSQRQKMRQAHNLEQARTRLAQMRRNN